MSLIRCQLSELQNGNITSTSSSFVPVNENATFTCNPGYVLIGLDTVQCILDDSMTGTKWSAEFPKCISDNQLIGKTFEEKMFASIVCMFLSSRYEKLFVNIPFAVYCFYYSNYMFFASWLSKRLSHDQPAYLQN